MDMSYFSAIAAHATTATALSDPAIVAKTIQPGVVFASVAYCSDASLQYAADHGPRLQKTMQHASNDVDPHTITMGYLSHTGTNLIFQTPDAVVFDVPLSQITAEEYSTGILLFILNKAYVFSSFYYITDQLPMQNKLTKIAIDNGSLWTKELATLGIVVAPARFQRKRVPRAGFIWVGVILLCSVFFVYFFGSFAT